MGGFSIIRLVCDVVSHLVLLTDPIVKTIDAVFGLYHRRVEASYALLEILPYLHSLIT